MNFEKTTEKIVDLFLSYEWIDREDIFIDHWDEDNELRVLISVNGCQITLMDDGHIGLSFDLSISTTGSADMTYKFCKLFPNEEIIIYEGYEECNNCGYLTFEHSIHGGEIHDCQEKPKIKNPVYDRFKPTYKYG